jgi:hypothetical protein
MSSVISYGPEFFDRTTAARSEIRGRELVTLCLGAVECNNGYY